MTELQHELEEADNLIARLQGKLIAKESAYKVLQQDLHDLYANWRETVEELKVARRALENIYQHSTTLAQGVLDLREMSKPEGDKQQWTN